MDLEFEFDLCHEATTAKATEIEITKVKNEIVVPGYKRECICCPYRHL